MTDPRKIDPVDLAMWIVALLLFILSGAIAIYLFRPFGGGGLPGAPGDTPAPSATESPTPVPTPEPKPTATAAPAPTATPEPSPTESPSPRPSPSQPPSPSPSPLPSPSPSPSPSPEPSPSPSPRPSPPPSPEPTFSPRPSPLPSPPPATVAPPPTARAKPTQRIPTPRPTPSPRPARRQPTRVPPPVERQSVGASVDIISDPPGAEVLLGGRPRGRTPLRLGGLAPGSYPLAVRKEGFLPYAEPVHVDEAGASYTVRVTLAPAVVADSFITVSSQPPGAAVKLDGKPSGVTPVTLGPLAPGRYELTIEYQDFPAQTRTLDVKAGALHEVKARFGTF